MIIAELLERNDSAGMGHYGAPRGDRTHKGVDYACLPGTRIFTPCNGVVSKIGYPYDPAGDDVGYRYVQITDHKGQFQRIFYVEPQVAVGDTVSRDSIIGAAQDITLRYPQYEGMTPHVHFEVKLPNGSYIDPSLA